MGQLATADGSGALLRIAGGALWRFRVTGGEVGIEDSRRVNALSDAEVLQRLRESYCGSIGYEVML